MPSCIDKSMAPSLGMFFRKHQPGRGYGPGDWPRSGWRVEGPGGSVYKHIRSCACMHVYAMFVHACAGGQAAANKALVHACARLCFACTRDTCIIYACVSICLSVCLSVCK